MKNNFLKMTRISTRITATFAILFFIVLLLINTAVLYGIRFYLLNQAFAYVDQLSPVIIDNIRESKKIENLKNRDLFSDITASENIYAKIYDKNGNLIAQSEKFNYELPYNNPVNFSIKKETKDKEVIYRNILTKLNDGSEIYVQIIKDLDNEYDFMQILFAAMIFTDIIGLFLAIIVGYIISKNTLKPIDKITNAAQNISAQNLKTRIEIEGPDDELSRLAKTFNDMIDRLQNSFERQNRFVSDASHELRTPIAVIQGYANMLLRWGKEDKNVLEESIIAIKNESENMKSIVEKLLFIARKDQGQLRLQKEKFYLNDLIDEIVKETRLITNKEIIQEKNEIYEVEADRKLMKEMIRIFIDNSLKFTCEDGRIKISLLKMKRGAKIVIEDNGIGIPKEDIPRIFDRFYRVDEARNKEDGGHGLGLSIAKIIADAHGFEINIVSQEGIGTTVEILF